MRALFKDPLAHFLAAGFALFIIASAINPPAPDDDTIRVDRAALLTFIQYRSKAFEPAAAAALLDGLDEEKRTRLIKDYVREEALAREAEALGLDVNDYVIRQRMVQKVEFLAEAAAPSEEPTEAEIAAFYDANRDRYMSPPSATLTHVFVNSADKSADAANEQARRLLAKLKADGAGFNDATKYGERFLFHKNYVDRTDDYIESQLGPAVAKAVFDPDTRLDDWLGPFRSEYGAHNIFVAARAPERLAPLSEITDVVESDLAEERRQIAIDRAIDAIVAKYRVEDRLGGSE